MVICSRRILLCSFLVVLNAACSPVEEGGDAALVRPAKIIQPALSQKVYKHNYPAVIQASEKVELAFRIAGQLVGLPVKSKGAVESGELLARLDETDFQNDLNEKAARFRLAKIQFDRFERLRKQNLVSQLASDEADTQLKAAQASFDQARDNLTYTRLVAPFSGSVGKVYVENFETVEKNAPVVLIQNIDQLEVEFSVPESHIVGLKKVSTLDGENVCGLLSLPTLPGTDIKACFNRFESLPDEITRNYTVYFSFEKPVGLNILPGMSASIELDMSDFIEKQESTTFFLPLGAVFEKEGASWVWRINEDSQVAQFPVEVIALHGGALEVAATLNPEDRIIGAAAGEFRQGMKVRAIIKERGL